MLTGDFNALWNKTFLYIGIGWLILIGMVWDSCYIVTVADHLLFAGVLVLGYLGSYFFGIFINSRHKRKLLLSKAANN
jgi:hypothetical protein